MDRNCKLGEQREVKCNVAFVVLSVWMNDEILLNLSYMILTAYLSQGTTRKYILMPRKNYLTNCADDVTTRTTSSAKVF